MKRAAIFVLVTFAFLLSFSAVAQEEHSLGAIREEVLPAWIRPAPELMYNQELDQQIDHSDELPPIGNQGSQGSCTAWATAYYYKTHEEWREHQWDLTDPAHQFSPAFIYNLINGCRDSGSYPSDAFLLFEQIGAGTMADMPYTDSECITYPSPEAFRNGIPYRTSDTYSINLRNESGMNTLRAHLMEGGIAATAMTVWPNFDNIAAYDYVYTVHDVYGEVRGGHAVAIVGFDDSFETADGVGAVRVVNSWGANWGDNGFFWMSYEALQNDIIGWGYALYSEDRIGYEPSLLAHVTVEHGDRHAVKFMLGFGERTMPLVTSSFFDDMVMSPRATQPFPETPIVLDFTEAHGLLDVDEPNDAFVRCRDSRNNNGFSGNIVGFELEELTHPHYAVAYDVPVPIYDNGSYGYSEITMDFRVIPPENPTSELSIASGIVNLEWDVIPTDEDFIDYRIYRDGVLVGSSTTNTFEDQLPSFDEFSYRVTSHWSTAESWMSEATRVNWISPLEPRFIYVSGLDGSTGDITLNWEQMRDEDIVYDDGVPDGNYSFNSSAPRNSIIAQRFTAPSNGQMHRIGAYFTETESCPMGRIRLLVYGEGASEETPGEILYRTPPFICSETGWNWLELEEARLTLNPGDDYWVGVMWVDTGCTQLGRDMDGEQYGRGSISVDGVEWRSISNGLSGNPMIRTVFGAYEELEGYTTLHGWYVYRDDAEVGYVTDPVIEDLLPSAGEYEYLIVADYEQGLVESEPYLLVWDGQSEVDETALPGEFEVSAPYPNPFNPSTSLNVTLPQAAVVNIHVYDVLGRQVMELANGHYAQGHYTFVFNADTIASGMYFIRTVIPGHVNDMRKVILMK